MQFYIFVQKTLCEQLDVSYNNIIHLTLTSSSFKTSSVVSIHVLEYFRHIDLRVMLLNHYF